MNMYVGPRTQRIKIFTPPPPPPTAGSLAALSCSNIVFLFIRGSGKYLPWAAEAGRIRLGSVSACQISLPANVSVIGKAGSATRRPPPPGGGAACWKFLSEHDRFVRRGRIFFLHASSASFLFGRTDASDAALKN